MEGSSGATPRSQTPRTPHSPSSSGGAPSGGMASPRASPAALVRPVTARTWQALSSSPAAAPEEPRRMSVYNNDLYNNSGAAAANPRPASPLYQPASARPGTPTPRSAERLQQQRITTPSRLQAEGAASPSQRLAAAAGAGLSTANVPAGTAQEQASVASSKRPATDVRPVTAPPQPPTGIGSPLRVTTFSLAALHVPQTAAAESPRPSTAGGPIPGSSIAVDSPRVRQQVLGHFASAVPAGATSHSRSASGGGATSPLGASPRPTLHGERGRGSGGGGPTARPSTPSFRPVAEAAARPATSMGAVQPQTSGPEHFSIRAVHQGAAGVGAAAPTALGAYPQPPMTAPPKAAAQPAAQDSQPPSVEPGSLASFGIAAGAFVAALAAPKAGGRTGEGALPAPRALTREAMLASASFATKGDLRRFLLTPGPADAPLQCKVLRLRGGLLRGAPLYTLLVEQEGGRGGTFLLAARKRKGGPGGATYVLSVDQHDTSSHSASFVGKLRSNFLGTEFVFHDAGDKHAADEAGGRCELGATMYQTNVLGSKGPRKMTVVLPKLDAAGQRPLAVSPRGEHDSLLGQYKAYSLSSCVVLRNKPPRWNQGLGAYCLNFGGRVTQASVKNFQLVSVDNMERTILQFGKVAKDAFTLDYCYPMTALQAFFICLSSMDSKLACE